MKRELKMKELLVTFVLDLLFEHVSVEMDTDGGRLVGIVGLFAVFTFSEVQEDICFGSEESLGRILGTHFFVDTLVVQGEDTGREDNCERCFLHFIIKIYLCILRSVISHIRLADVIKS